MNAQQFVALWKREKAEMLRLFTEPESQSVVAAEVRAMNLAPAQREQLQAVLDLVLTDVMYTLLLGLDGAASIGGVQQRYELRAEDGAPIAGDLEEEAWGQFHGAR